MIQKLSQIILITGTHLTPALELIRQLQNDSKTDWQIHYIGRSSNSNDPKDISIESIIIPKENVKFYSIPCGKLDRRFLPNTIAGIPKTISGFIQAFKLIKKIKPNIIVSFGGYVSVPVVINGWIKHITSITHEQTLTNSLTTKINSLFVNKVALSFENQNQVKQLNQNKVVVTGNLLRYDLFNSKISKPNPQFSTQKPTIYITAGNQGSHFINSAVTEILPELKKFQVIHQTGKADYLNLKKLESKYPYYFSFDYLDTSYLTWIIHNSDILISRSGANTSQEIFAFNKKSILIPLPKSQQNEQLLNALWVKEKLPNTTIILPQEKLTPQKLLFSIKSLSKIKNQLSTFHYQPNLKLLQLIHEII
jgi:UDP-N-acetylglucosamine--N-acetylmuramyl-(pentapeptide) pyrophosphoryl-undecaprenol N-acetylglucosamine transferase